ncbi:hypothetical protein BH11PSE8_BH11PSE8_46900 [soil metagenome]
MPENKNAWENLDRFFQALVPDLRIDDVVEAVNQWGKTNLTSHELSSLVAKYFPIEMSSSPAYSKGLPFGQ